MKRINWEERSDEDVLRKTSTLKTWGERTVKVRKDVNVNSQVKRIDLKVKIWEEWVDLFRAHVEELRELLTLAWEIWTIG